MRISAISGADYEELLKGNTGKAVNSNSEPLTRDFYLKRISMFRLTEDASVPDYVTERDIIDFPSLIQMLQSHLPRDPLTRYLQDHLSPKTKKALANYKEDSGNDEYEIKLKPLLIDDLNRLMRVENFYDKARFKGIQLSELTETFLRKSQRVDIARLNRLLLEDAYPREIRKHRTAEDQANYHAKYINEFVNMVLLAASQGNAPVLGAVARAMIQAIDKIRHSFNLQDKMWTEWERRRVEKIPYPKPGTKSAAGNDASESGDSKDGGSYYTKFDPTLPSLLYLTDPVAQKWLGLNFDAEFAKPPAPPGKSGAKKRNSKKRT
jgi:hypothetical protein